MARRRHFSSASASVLLFLGTLFAAALLVVCFLPVTMVGAAVSLQRDLMPTTPSGESAPGVPPGPGAVGEVDDAAPAAAAATAAAAMAANDGAAEMCPSSAEDLSDLSDADSDGMSDRAEGVSDTDSDSIPDFQDGDSDGDGVPDAVEMVFGDNVDGDSDSDSIPDHKDSDTVDLDGDGFDTEYADADGDGRLSPQELDAKEDYQHLLCLDTDEDYAVTKRELQDAFSEYRRTPLWEFAPADTMEWVRTSPQLFALKEFADRFASIGGPLLFDYVVMKPYKVRTKLGLNEDATGELRLAVCDVIASQREARLAREGAERGGAELAAESAGGGRGGTASGTGDNASAPWPYTSSESVNWLLDKIDNLPWWAQGVFVAVFLLLCSTYFYHLERSSVADKERELRQQEAREQEERRRAEAAEQRRLERQLKQAELRRKAEAADEERRTRRLRDTAKTSGKPTHRRGNSYNGLKTVDECSELPHGARSLGDALGAADAVAGGRGAKVRRQGSGSLRGVAKGHRHRSGSDLSSMSPRSPSNDSRIQATSKCMDLISSSTILDSVPAGVVHMHRTRVGVIPYNNLQFGRLQNLRIFRLDGRHESDFAVRIPPNFRDSLEMIYGDGRVGPTKKRMFHLHYEFYDPSDPGSSSTPSPSAHRWPKRSNSDKLKTFIVDGGSISAPVSAAAIRKQHSAHALDESGIARPSILHSMSAPSSTRHTPTGVAATAVAGTARGYKRDGKDIDVIVIYREIAHPNSALKKAADVDGMTWRKEFCVIDELTEVTWSGADQSRKSKLTISNCLCPRESHRPNRGTRTLTVVQEKDNYEIVEAWILVLQDYIEAAKIRRIERDRHSVAYPGQMALE